MNPAAARIINQLRTPDRAGRDLALLRTRLYRFSDDLRWYVLAEALEEYLLAGQQPQPATINAVRACLEQIRRNGSPSTFQGALATAQNIDITTALTECAAYMWQQVPWVTPPSMVVIIVGAPPVSPRSGQEAHPDHPRPHPDTRTRARVAGQVICYLAARLGRAPGGRCA